MHVVHAHRGRSTIDETQPAARGRRQVPSGFVAHVLRLQRLAGNAATQAWLRDDASGVLVQRMEVSAARELLATHGRDDREWFEEWLKTAGDEAVKAKLGPLELGDAARLLSLVREYRAGATPKGGLETGLNVDDYEVSDTEDVSFMHEGKVFSMCPLVTPKAGGGTSSEPMTSKLSRGALLCLVEDPKTAIMRVTAQMITDYFETPKKDEDELGPQGSFAAKEGYTRREGFGADERYNCAAWAHGAPAWIEPDQMHDLLKGHGYERVPERHRAMMVGSEYVLATQFHFIKVKKTGPSSYQTSEKNGFSGVYDRSPNEEQMQALMEKYSNAELFKKTGT